MTALEPVFVDIVTPIGIGATAEIDVPVPPAPDGESVSGVYIEYETRLRARTRELVEEEWIVFDARIIRGNWPPLPAFTLRGPSWRRSSSYKPFSIGGRRSQEINEFLGGGDGQIITAAWWSDPTVRLYAEGNVRQIRGDGVDWDWRGLFTRIRLDYVSE